MKSKIFLIFLLFIVVSCKKEVKNTNENWVKISERIQYLKDKDVVRVKSGNFNYSIKKSLLPFKKVMLLNSSLMGYFLELGKEDVITGISSPEFVYSDKIRALLKTGKIQNIGSEQKYDVEKIIAFQPEAVFCNYVESFENTYNILRQNNIQVIFIDEYLEESPLDKSRILELFGVLLGNENEAQLKYKDIEKKYESYKAIAAKSQHQPQVLTNEMYGNQWFLAGGKSNVAQLFKDANANYILKDNTSSAGVPMSFEEVFVKSKNVEYWVNVGDHKNRKKLLAINPNYAKMEVYQKGKLYSLNGSVNGKSNDAFESGVVRADVFLRDYIKVVHPELFSAEQLIYLKQIE